MEGSYAGVQTPEAYAALWRGRRETGGALLAAGAVAWLIHSVLMIVGLVAIFSISLTNANAAAQSALAGITAFIAATVAVLLATFLVGAGLLVYQGGTHGLTAHEWWSGVTHSVSQTTQMKAKTGAVFVILYGVLGIIVIGIYAGLMNSASNLETTAVLNGLKAILALWIVASVILIIGSALVSSFLNSLRVETATLQAFSGTGFLAYSILSAVGVFLFAGSLLAIASNPLSAQIGLIIPILIGAVIGLLVVPIAGMVVFSLLIAHGLRLRKLQPWSRPAPGYYPPVSSSLGPYYALPTAPSMVPPSVPMAAYGMSSPPIAGPYQTPGNPPPPPVDVPPTNPVASLAPPPPAQAGDANWVLRLQGQIEGLERAVNEQKDFLFQVERSLVEGRIDNATFSNIVRNRTSRIAEFEREIAETKGKLSEKPAGRTGPEPSSEPSDEIDKL